MAAKKKVTTTKVAKKKAIAKKKVSSTRRAVKSPSEGRPKTRTRPPAPDFLSGTKKQRMQGIEVMMSSWTEFIKVPLAYLEEKEIAELLEVEAASRKRWAIVNRLHSAYCTKRAKRERKEYRKGCGLS